MFHHLRSLWKKLGIREKRLFVYLGVVFVFAAWKFTPRYWRPTSVVETEHYVIQSSATPEQTADVARHVEILYSAYSNRFSNLATFQRQHPKLKLLLYKDEKEFRRINPGVGWAEAFYKNPYCRAYYAADESNPYHWMLHEAVHQLNEEVAGLDLEKWLDEGVAEYFAVSRIQDGAVRLGTIDPNVYPIWWIDEIATSTDPQANLKNGSAIPLKAIITDRGGPRLNSHVNLYYLHWWSLTHFIFEESSYEENLLQLLQEGGRLDAFERLIVPIAVVQPRWHSHVRGIKSALAGNDPGFQATGELPTRLGDQQAPR